MHQSDGYTIRARHGPGVLLNSGYASDDTCESICEDLRVPSAVICGHLGSSGIPENAPYLNFARADEKVT
jgi:hypothetical protein